MSEANRAAQDAGDRIRKRGGIVNQRSLARELYGEPWPDPRELKVDGSGLPARPPVPSEAERERQEAEREQREAKARQKRQAAEAEVAATDPHEKLRGSRREELIAALDADELAYVERQGLDPVKFARMKSVTDSEAYAEAVAELDRLGQHDALVERVRSRLYGP
jgi:hypothetical protein